MHAWLVTMKMQDGTTATVRVGALTKENAECRAAGECERLYGNVERVLVIRRAAKYA